MTDYFGIITKYFDGKLEYKTGGLYRYRICDTTILWDSFDKKIYVGNASNFGWSFIYKAPFSRLYIVTDMLEPEDLDPSKSLTVYIDDICKAIVTGGVTGLSALYDIMYMENVLQ